MSCCGNLLDRVKACGGDPIDQCATVFGAKMQSKFKRNKKLSKWPVEDVFPFDNRIVPTDVEAEITIFQGTCEFMT